MQRFYLPYKRSFFMLLIAALLLSCTSKSKENDIAKDQLKGQVKFYKQSCYTAEQHSNKVVKGRLRVNYPGDHHQTFYNPKGNRTEYIQYDSRDNPNTTISYTYNPKGNKVQEQYCKEKEECRAYTYSFDSEGNLSKTYESLGQEKKLLVASYTYDKANNLIVYSEHNASGGVYRKETYSYDDRGNKTKSIRYQPNGRVDQIKTFQYDSIGNNTRTELYYKEDQLEERYDYQYDKAGKVKVYIRYAGDLSLITKFYYTRDDQGNPLTETRYYADTKLRQKFSYSYQYDSSGNWIHKTVYRNDTPEFIYQRAYTYY